jgi:hypothetical protein
MARLGHVSAPSRVRNVARAQGGDEDVGGKAAAGSSDYSDILKQLFGIFLVGLNLSLDGYTNNEQDFIFKNL